MNYNFEDCLYTKLVNIAVNLNLDVKIEVSAEQVFAEMKTFDPDTIYIVVKYLTSDIQFNAETTPIQIIALSEQDSLDKTKMILNKFSTDNNWQVIIDNGTYIKQQYTSPVVLNNFSEVGRGTRSILYITGTLFIMENVIDIKKVEIDDVEYKPIGTNISYSMSVDTQQMPNNNIAISTKTVSTFAMTLTIPMIASDFIEDVLDILSEESNGNKDFRVKITFQNNLVIQKDMKVINAQILTGINQVPSLQVGLMR